jgi:predicted DNA-binding transcriptional regulator YafY
MAKHEQILRLMITAELLKRKPKGITFQETNDYLERQFFERGLELKFSEKTFKRDRELIAEVLGLKSNFNRSTGKFQIVNDELDVETDNVFDNILLIDAYRQSKGNADIMLFEKRKARGLNHLNGILHAIQNKKIISFNYNRFYEREPEKCVVNSYALKEFKYRWYLLAKYKNGENAGLKIFGLDRISDLEIFNSSFVRKDFQVEDVFKNSFGIFTTLNEKPSEIVLSFTAFQGKYIKSLPLHHSQEILEDNENELKIKLTLVPTYDFVQEILSQGNSVEVVSPESFRTEILEMIEEMRGNYV